MSLTIASVFSAGLGGFFAGLYLADFDENCQRQYVTYTVKTALVSDNGIRIPAGSTVQGRECGPNIGLKALFTVSSEHEDALVQLKAASPPTHGDQALSIESPTAADTP